MREAPPATPEAARTRLTARAAWRYSLLVAALVAPLNVINLGFLTLPLAVWAIARLFARRYGRQMTARETRLLALTSWTWMAVAGLAPWVAAGARPALLPVLVPGRVVDFLLVWAAYLWFARYVVRRHLQPDAVPRATVASASEMLEQQAEEYQEANARTLTLAALWLAVGPLGLLLVVLLSVAVFIVLALFGVPLDAGAWMLGAMSVAMPVLLASWAYFLSRKAAEVFPSHRMVLWLRRFHRADLMEFSFPYFLERACRGIAVPITLQDSTVPRARTAAELRPAFHVQRAAAMAGQLIFLAALFELSRRDSWADPQGLLLAIVALLALGAIVTLTIFIRSLGVVRLGTTRGEHLIRQLLDAIDSEAGVPQTLTIVSAPDESWQSWVLEFVGRADAVLMDVTHLSPNLQWELRTLREHLQPKQLILAYGVRDGDELTIPADVQGELVNLLGTEGFGQSQRFFYRLERGGFMSRLQFGNAQRGWLPLGKERRNRYSSQLVQALHDAFEAAVATENSIGRC